VGEVAQAAHQPPHLRPQCIAMEGPARGTDPVLSGRGRQVADVDGSARHVPPAVPDAPVSWELKTGVATS
jgi:hypothetical protein